MSNEEKEKLVSDFFARIQSFSSIKNPDIMAIEYAKLITNLGDTLSKVYENGFFEGRKQWIKTFEPN